MAITLRRQLDDEEKAIIAQRFGRKCFVTGHSIADDESIQYDHIRAFALGGKSELDNIAPMCEHHNKAKGMLPLEDFRIKLQIEEFFQVGERLTL
jgi:5-methylcytosine-specific restriction endonuclease McrA